MKTSPHIFKNEPYLVEKVWGGRRLETHFGKELPTQKCYGEAWEVADLDEGQSRVGSGPLKGLPLRALAEGWRRALVGRRAVREDRFPLLVKLLDAQRDLSVQVHPGPKDAKRIEGASSKCETWLILDVSDDGEIIHGLGENGVSTSDFRKAVAEGAVEELLQRVPVAAGDVVDVVPGTIHAICAGVALLEIQEPSDTTYRIYDYDRPGIDGKPRQLHLDRAMEVARLERSDEILRPVRVIEDGLDLLACTPVYRIERLYISEAGAVSWQVDPESPQVLHVLEGELVVEDGIGGSIELGAHESAVVPAMVGSVCCEFDQDSTVVVSGLAVEKLVRGLQVDEMSAMTS